MAGVLRELAGEIMVLYGGTRTSVRPMRVNRPWQVGLKFQTKDDCPFCSRTQLDEYFPEPGWKTFQNAATPWPWHRLLIPTECWDEQTLWSLGGKERIATILSLSLKEILRTRRSPYVVRVHVHVGYGGGQNYPHQHTHILEEPIGPIALFDDARFWGNLTVLQDSERFITALYGVRAGQCYIYHKSRISARPFLSNEDGLVDELAAEISRLIDLFNRKCENPDYALTIALDGPRQWYASYTPILNQWGGPELAAINDRTVYVHPWPPIAMRDYLLAD